MTKTYFILRNLSYEPSGVIDLGKIVSSPKTPDQPLNPESRLPVEDLNIERVVEDNWKKTVKEHSHGHIGIWAKFVETFGGQGSITRDRTKSQKYTFEQLETRHFRPNKTLLENQLAISTVDEYIKAHKFSKNVYMITGIKIATKAFVSDEESIEWKARFAIGANLTATGTPVSFGPDAAISSEVTDTTSTSIKKSFVFAYRLTEIYYEKGLIMARDKEGGDLYNIESQSKDGDSFEYQEPFVRWTGSGDVGAESEPGLMTEVAIDEVDGKECECVFI
jgi:hypothetical protein